MRLDEALHLITDIASSSVVNDAGCVVGGAVCGSGGHGPPRGWV